MKPLSECRVLLVDDARTNLDILVEGLKSEHKLSLALDGQSALQLAARTPPDLVLLDIVMPGLNGYEVCHRLRQMPETAEVPIIFLSSLEDVRDKTRGFEAGANDYLTKPFEMLEVKARVRSLLKAKAYSDAVKEQLAADLRIAREIQMGMLPQDFSALERRFGVELASTLQPAREVGGDLFGAFAVSKDCLVLFMGDVSGKGIPASLFMVRADTLVRLLARQIRAPERILQALNDELAADNPSGMFVTLVCAIFEPATGRLALANGGQTPPLLVRPGQPPRRVAPSLGTALGLEPGLAFAPTELQLSPADTLVFYTDGITEAFNPAGECYGAERLLACLNRAASPGPSLPEEEPGRNRGGLVPCPAALACGIQADVRAFAQGAPQSDDIALLVLRAGNRPAPGILPARTLELQATPQEVMRAVESLEVFCREHQVPEPLIFGLKLALEETGSNIVNHAYQKEARSQFTVSFQHLGDRILLETRDRGPAFNPLTAPAPVLNAPADGAPPGGLGIYLARQYLDDITYTREGAVNVLRMSRLLSSRSPRASGKLSQLS